VGQSNLIEDRWCWSGGQWCWFMRQVGHSKGLDLPKEEMSQPGNNLEKFHHPEQEADLQR
jgi:hypothetical protein